MRSEPDLTVVGLVFFEVFVPGREPPPPGREVFVPRIPLGVGGAANTASVARALGLSVRLIYPAGDGLADAAVEAALTRAGIDAQPYPGPDDPAITLVFSEPGVDRGFLSAAAYRTLAEAPTLPKSGWIHVPGLAEAEALAEPLARARGGGARVSVSAGWTPEGLARLGDTAAPRWDLLFLNEDEARAALGGEGAPDPTPERLAHVAESVIITRGDDGAQAILQGEAIRSKAERASVFDTTGAGDAFAAGVITGWVRGRPPAARLALGHAAAARQLAARGGFAKRDDYEDLRTDT